MVCRDCLDRILLGLYYDYLYFDRGSLSFFAIKCLGGSVCFWVEALLHIPLRPWLFLGHLRMIVVYQLDALLEFGSFGLLLNERFDGTLIAVL